MRLSCIAIVASMSLAFAAFADDSAAELTFSEVAAMLAEPAVIRGAFTQTRYLKHGEFVSSGNFVLSDLGLYWHQAHPVAAVMIADGERLLQSVGANPLQSIDVNANPLILSFSDTFLRIFEGKEDELRENFRVEFTTHGDDWTATLIPSDELMAAAIDAINLRGREYIDELTVITRASERMVIAFSNLKSEPDHLTDDEIELYAR